ncbi:hypothetical protein BP00DRAFT_418575 [Aspergillus indologenus CBS 114.80]|uniref:Uncharacterized protein n=1 Tax=Aspergillus indologenus CBS 114.80 TaxID=1450541 RepID=A0A2V5HYJ6_9EURO|nr:hypothetical protein BP00DRAFT_418575 [Aspergillus indologenus CBS 114.80]
MEDHEAPWHHCIGKWGSNLSYWFEMTTNTTDHIPGPSPRAPLSHGGETQITLIIARLRQEQEPIVRFWQGRRLEDLFSGNSAAPRPLTLGRRPGKIARLHYITNIYLKTLQFFQDYPSFDTRKENTALWENPANPGKKGRKGDFAAKHGYPLADTLVALGRGGKLKALESHLDEPGIVPLLFGVVQMLDRLTLHDTKELARLLPIHCPILLATGCLVRKKWTLYLECYSQWALVETPSSQGHNTQI